MPTLREALGALPGALFADLLESDDAYLVVLDLPGADAESTTIDLEGGRLHIEAHRDKAVPDGFSFEREERPVFLDVDLPLPPDATGADATASIEQGVLEIHLPRRSTAPGTSIPIE